MEIAGVRIDNLTLDEVLERVAGFLSGDRQHYAVLPYSEFFVQARRYEDFRAILNRADLSLCESRGLFFALRLSGQPVKEQIAGVDLVRAVAQRYGRIFLLGGGRSVAEGTARVLGPRVVGCCDGYQELAGAVAKINQTRAQILFVALGAPRQEQWISEHLKEMPTVRFAVGVGGAFDFISGCASRAPRLMRQAGLEWLWRFGREPWRARRIFDAVVIFPWLVMKSMIY